MKLTSPTLIQEVDNTPDMNAAVDLEDNVGGENLIWMFQRGPDLLSMYQSFRKVRE